jgi:hypothetical protein
MMSKMKIKILVTFFLFFICSFSLKAQTIGDLLEKLTAVIYSSENPQTKECFAKLYRETTQYVEEGVGNNYYSSDEFITETEVKFGDFYFDAIKQNPNLSYGWSIALNDSITRNCNDIQKILLAMNAHINDDLLPTLLLLDRNADMIKRKSDMDKQELKS